MNITLFLFITLCAIILQVFTIVMVLRMISLTKKYKPWILISLALILTQAREYVILYYSSVSYQASLHNTVTELAVLFISLFFLLGMIKLAPVFISMQNHEKALRESEERYRYLFEHNPMPMWIYDSETLHFMTVNNAAVSAYGYSETEFLSMTILDIRPREDKTGTKSTAQSASQKGMHYAGSWKHIKKDGSMMDVEITSYPTTFKKRKARLILANDITAKIRAERLFRESEEKYRKLVETMNEGLVYLDSNNVIQYANDYFCHSLGYTKDDLAGKNVFGTLLDEKERPALEERMRQRREGKSEKYEIMLRKKSGEQLRSSVSATPLFDEGGKFLGSISVQKVL